MTKRDYELIAAVMLYARPEGIENTLSGQDRMITWERAVKEFERVLSAANPKFDAAKFRKACGMHCQ